MKTNFSAYPFRGLGLLFPMLALCWLAGCCDGEVYINGRVMDDSTGAPLDNVRVSLFYVEKKQAEISLVEYSDSLGRFSLYDFGYCGNTDFFILATKPGYVSQTLDVEPFGSDVEIRLDPD